jgi:peptide/nickel transport system substrate-binding protein
MKRRIIALLLVAFMAMAIVGCGPSTTPQDTSRDSVFVAVSAIGNTLDAAIANFTNVSIVTSHIYDYIIGVDEDFNFEPGVASSWAQVDNVTFKFTVDDGFVFHNGEPLEMEDVIFSIERLRGIPGCASYMNNVGSVEQTGDREITVKLVEPNASTIRSLLQGAQVYNKSYCESVGEAYANEPCGTGPYMVKSFIPGDKVELEVWEDYPFEKPAIKNITFKTIEEDANRYISLETGEAQFAAISYHDLDRAENNDKLVAIKKETTNTAFISMNTKKAPFDNKNVRLAMAHATDKEGLATVQGGATVIHSMTPPMFSTYYESPNTPEFDLEKAKALLAAEGYDESNPLTFEMWTYGGNTSVAQAYQAALKSIGVNMDIKSLEFGVFLEGMANGEYQMLTGSWNNISGDPLSALENYWSGSFGSQNISFFENARCDELYDIAKAAPDEETLIEAAKEVQDIAASEMPIIPTYSRLAIFGADKGLKGVRIFSSGMYSFRNAYYE